MEFKKAPYWAILGGKNNEMTYTMNLCKKQEEEQEGKIYDIKEHFLR